jgi:hypothetical protein
MCNPSNIEALLWLAQGCYIAATIALGILIFNSASFFAAAANIGVMALVIAAHGSSILFFSLALGELNDCPNTVCTADFDFIKTMLALVIADLSIITGLLIALAIVAAIPFAGAIAAGPVLAKLVTIGVSSFFSDGIMVLTVLAGIVSTAFVFVAIPKLPTPK